MGLWVNINVLLLLLLRGAFVPYEAVGWSFLISLVYQCIEKTLKRLQK